MTKATSAPSRGVGGSQPGKYPVMWSLPALPFDVLPRARLAEWLAPPRPAVWLLVAGPGTEKTLALATLVPQLGDSFFAIQTKPWTH